jgi:phage tail sheath gpL-like
MTLQSTSLAAAVAAKVQNKQFQPAANNVPRKILIIGTYDPLKTTLVEDEPLQVFSPEDVGDKCGFGFMLHRLAVATNLGAQGLETWIVPQAEISGSAQADGTITVTASSVLAGTLAIYIAGIYVPVVVTESMTDAEIATAIAAAINADTDLPVTASATDEVVTVTSKSTGPWGNFISMRVNINAGDAYPSGVSVEFVDMSGGSGTPDIETALDALGTGDNANENRFTDLVHGYGWVTAVLDDISTYVGAGNTAVGLWDSLVARPLRSLSGDTVNGSAGLSALVAFTGDRKTDRANGIVSVPGSATHPAEIAAQTMGHMARINNDRAAQHYVDVQLFGVDPGTASNRWTSDYDNRDIAVKAGISPTIVRSGVVYLQNIVTFYRPASVPVTSNGYRSMRNISILQNILYNVIVNFSQEKWQGISIVQNSAKVSSAVDRQKVRDVDAVINELMLLAKAFMGKGWIYDDGFTISKLKETGAVSIRSGTTGFDAVLSIILSGEGGILNTLVEFDTSIAALG